QQRVHGDAALGCQHLQRFHHVEVAHRFVAFAVALAEPGFGVACHSKTVRARSIWSKRTVVSSPTVTVSSSEAVTTPSSRRSPSKSAVALMRTLVPSAPAKWAGVRSGRS